MRLVVWLVLALLGWGGFRDVREQKKAVPPAPAQQAAPLTAYEGGEGKPPCCP